MVSHVETLALHVFASTILLRLRCLLAFPSQLGIVGGSGLTQEMPLLHNPHSKIFRGPRNEVVDLGFLVIEEIKGSWYALSNRCRPQFGTSHSHQICRLNFVVHCA